MGAAESIGRWSAHTAGPAAVNVSSLSAARARPGASARPAAPEAWARELEGRVGEHLEASAQAILGLRSQSALIGRWSAVLAERLHAGARLLAAGNGGSAAEAQHLTAELVGRYDGDRPAYSAIALHADTSAVTAIGNDYGYAEVFARQVRAHARPGDIVLLLSTSGASANLLAAAGAARDCGALTWALTGPAPNPLASAVDEVLALEARSCHVQESQLVAIHALCEGFDACVAELEGRSSRQHGETRQHGEEG
ncbi:SIS domain-containing protein [Sinomonas halotolerans]|uniref:SIS domain-containing protein n=1 Tax=Sinomonas halotolerans TaxID=1644133 RepID=A0ABU9X0E2_9MICC